VLESKRRGKFHNFELWEFGWQCSMRTFKESELKASLGFWNSQGRSKLLHEFIWLKDSQWISSFQFEFYCYSILDLEEGTLLGVYLRLYFSRLPTWKPTLYGWEGHLGIGCLGRLSFALNTGRRDREVKTMCALTESSSIKLLVTGYNHLALQPSISLQPNSCSRLERCSFSVLLIS